MDQIGTNYKLKRLTRLNLFFIAICILLIATSHARVLNLKTVLLAQLEILEKIDRNQTMLLEKLDKQLDDKLISCNDAIETSQNPSNSKDSRENQNNLIQPEEKSSDEIKSLPEQNKDLSNMSIGSFQRA
ncbi:MAG: hypothetical protein VX335_04890 [Pseudomonadota bacterium]|nr:hypothetical protein [Pseudomonadota bacterium]